jgi:multidrug resistance efflux pump
MTRSTSGFESRYPMAVKRLSTLLKRQGGVQRAVLLGALSMAGLVSLSIPYPEPLVMQGVITSRIARSVSSPFGGTINEVLVSPNSWVKKGEPVVLMASPDYREEQAKLLTELRTIKRSILQDLALLPTQTTKDDAVFISRVRQQLSQIPSESNTILNRETLQATAAELSTARQLVSEKEASLARLQGKLSDFEQEVSIQRRQLDRYRSAADTGAISRVFFEQQLREVAKSEKELNDTRASIVEASAQLAQSKSQLVLVQSRRSVASLEKIDALLPRLSFLLERYDRFKQAGEFSVVAPESGTVAGLESLRQGLSISQGQALFTIVDSSGGFGLDASTDALIRRKLSSGQSAFAEFVNPVDGRTVRIPILVGSVSPISLEDLRGGAALNQRKTANFSVTLDPDPKRGSPQQIALLRSLQVGEVIKVTVEGPPTNMLATFIRPLRLNFSRWLD